MHESSKLNDTNGYQCERNVMILIVALLGDLFVVCLGVFGLRNTACLFSDQNNVSVDLPDALFEHLTIFNDQMIHCYL